MRRFVCLILATIALASCSDRLIYKDKDAPIEDRVSDLLKRMTIKEKTGQLLCPLGWFMYEKTDDKTVELSALFKQRMNDMPIGGAWAVLRADPWTQKTLESGLNPRQSAEVMNKMQRYAVENTRLGIPILFAEEATHGHMAIGTTTFPTGIGQACTFDADLLQQMGQSVALEVRLQGGQVGFGPVLDLARDARWGRFEETLGEDPVLAGVYGIDTRALTKQLREKGSMLGRISIEGCADVENYDPNKENLVGKVSCKEVIEYSLPSCLPYPGHLGH